MKPKGIYVRRFSTLQRVQHVLLMVSFLGLAGTGLPLLFSHTRWAYYLARAWGGFELAAALHRFFGVVLIGMFLSHVIALLYGLLVQRNWSLLWGPRSMMPQPYDVRDIVAHLKWFVRGGPRPKFDHFTYWEKFDYFAVFWGVVMIGGSGLVLWFPEWFATFLPGWMLNVCEIVHGEEALMAICFIFIVHFFNAHLRPGKFPMDVSIFTGTIPRHELEDERGYEYDRIMQEGSLVKIEAPQPTRQQLIFAWTLGGVGVIFGLLLVFLVLYAAFGAIR
jgi:cytochrome b subunit of formate dehydrogenase